MTDKRSPEEVQKEFDDKIAEINREYTRAATQHGHLAQQIDNAELFISRGKNQLVTLIQLMHRLGKSADKLRQKSGIAAVPTSEDEVLNTKEIEEIAEQAELEQKEGA